MAWPAMIGQLLKAVGPELVKEATKSQGGASSLARTFGNVGRQAQTGGGPVGDILRGYAEQQGGSLSNPMGVLGGAAPLLTGGFSLAKGAVTGAANAFKQDTPFAAGAEFVKALPLGPVSSFGAKLLESVDGIRTFGDHLHKMNTSFADVSVGMANVDYESRAHAMLLRQQQGEQRAATAMELSEAQTRLNAAAAPFEDAWANIRNKAMAPVMEGLASLLEGLEPLADKMEDFADGIGEAIDKVRQFVAGVGGFIDRFGSRPVAGAIRAVASRIGIGGR